MAQSVDTVTPFFRAGNYAPVDDELTAFDLRVTGTIPAEPDGWYLRNGPNPRQSTDHWFTGDGVIHGVRLENGRAAWYRNRWVRTDSFENDLPFYNQDGTRNLHASVANTHVVRHAGRTWMSAAATLAVREGLEPPFGGLTLPSVWCIAGPFLWTHGLDIAPDTLAASLRDELVRVDATMLYPDADVGGAP